MDIDDCGTKRRRGVALDANNLGGELAHIYEEVARCCGLRPQNFDGAPPPIRKARLHCALKNAMVFRAAAKWLDEQIDASRANARASDIERLQKMARLYGCVLESILLGSNRPPETPFCSVIMSPDDCRAASVIEDSISGVTRRPMIWKEVCKCLPPRDSIDTVAVEMVGPRIYLTTDNRRGNRPRDAQPFIELRDMCYCNGVCGSGDTWNCAFSVFID